MAGRKDIVAIVGGGKGGYTILRKLLRTRGVEVRYMYDRSPDAPGMILAREQGITCSTNPTFPELWGNREISVILEVTGSESVFRSLGGIKAQSTSLIGARGNHLVFDMLTSESRVRERLEQYQGKLKQLVSKRTADLRQANRELSDRLRELQSANKMIEELSQQKTRYLLRSTHELKAPFAAIQSYTDLILQGYTGELTDQTRSVIQRIKQRCEALSSAIQEMLQLASLQAGEASQVKHKSTDVNRLLKRVVAGHRVLAESGGIELLFLPEPGQVRVQCEPAHLRTLFVILVRNAIDYSRPGSTVRVTVSRGDGQAVVQVKDRGIGIRADARKKIFSEFYRTNEAADKYPEGSGLGLAIAARIASLNGFKITLRSAVGKGSTFSVTMPVRQAPKPV